MDDKTYRLFGVKMDRRLWASFWLGIALLVIGVLIVILSSPILFDLIGVLTGAVGAIIIYNLLRQLVNCSHERRGSKALKNLLAMLRKPWNG